MSIPVGPPTGPSYTIPIGFASGSATLTVKDSLSLFDFLQLQSKTKDNHKQTVFDGQAVDAVVNKEYFLGVVEALQFLANKYAELIIYANDADTLTKDYNNSVDDLNDVIDIYNTAKNVLNSKIDAMNNAINTINGIASPTASDIAAYNNAVTIYNNYLTSTGNPKMLAYITNSDNVYNIPTNIANTVTIPAINQVNQDLGIGIPPIPLLTPATAPVGAGVQSLQPSYSGTPIPLIPSSYPDLSHLSKLPPAKTKTELIDTYFLPYATNYLAAIAAVGKKLASVDDYRGFVNFILKQGFKLNPAMVNAFIMNSAKPSLPGGGESSGGTIGSLIVGLDTPNLERILSTALFKEIAGAASISLPPEIYDQINALALSLLERVSASAGLAIIKLLGDTLKSLRPDTEAVSVALAAALLQSILKVVIDGKATKEALLKILSGVEGISDAQKQDLTNQLLASQNLALLNLGAVSTGLLLKNPALVPNILNTSTSNLNTSTSNVVDLSAEEDVEPQANAYSPFTVNGIFGDQQSSFAIKPQLSDRLAQDAKIPKPQAESIINQTVNNLPPNATPQQFQTSLADQLLKQNLKTENIQFFAENARAIIDTAIQQRQAENLAKELKSSINNVLKPDVVNPLPTSIAASLIKSLTDTQDPNSFASLMVSQIRTLTKDNDKQVAAEIVAQRREVSKPEIDVFVTLQRLLNPANNIIMSFVTGLMYDKSIPTNWQKPLQIQV